MACPSFALDGSAGIAAALRSVDCSMDGAAATAFGRIFGGASGLGPALSLCLGLYIALFGVNLLSGRANLSLPSLTRRVIALGLIMTFATSWIAYRTVVWGTLTAGPDQIASVALGVHGSATMIFADRLDRIFSIITQAAEAMQSGQSGAEKARIVSPSDLLWLSGLMLLLGTVGVLLVTRIALAAVLVLGPVFMLCAMFKASRGLFEGWLKAAFLLALTPMLTVFLGGGALVMLSPVVRSIEMSGADISFRQALTMFLGAAVYCALVGMAFKVANVMIAGWRLPGVAGDETTRERDDARTLSPGAADFTSVRGEDHSRSLAHAMTSAPVMAPSVSEIQRTRFVGALETTYGREPHAGAFSPPRARGLGERFRARARRGAQFRGGR